MAMTAVAVKAALTALTDERTRKNVGWIAAAILAPIILIAPLLLSLLSGTTQHNNAAVDLVFNGGVIPSTVSAEYAAQVRIMQTCLGMLDSTLPPDLRSPCEAEMFFLPTPGMYDGQMNER